MERAIDSLRAGTFDLLVIGGGVYGASVAREASGAGLSVALIERGDFASGTSSNCLKILHGGLRYLQQLDFFRMRDSIRARREWARLAPDLVRPLPCAMATHGLGLRSAPVIAAALMANDLVSADRNVGLVAECHLPRGRLLSRKEYAHMVDMLVSPDDRGGALWWDAIALDPEGLVLDLLTRATGLGAVIANYVEAVGLLTADRGVQGVAAIDRESGMEFEIKAQNVLCASGAATENLVGSLGPKIGLRRRSWCAAVNVLLKQDMHSDAAVALSARLPAIAGGMAAKGSRELFFVPWRARTMVGTHYAMPGDSDGPSARKAVVAELLEQIREVAPRAAAEEHDVCFVHWGMLPLSRGWQQGAPLQLDSTVEVIGGSTGMARGLWIVQGPKFTTALGVASRLVAKIAAQLPIRPVRKTERGPVPHAAVAADSVLSLEAQAESAAIHSWARHLEDVVFRRGGCGSAGYPGKKALSSCARGLGRALEWSDTRVAAEVAAVQDQYRRHHFWDGSERAE